MAKEKKIVIKEAILSNNCPECFNQNLKLIFYQKHTFNAFYRKVTNMVEHEIKCKKCHSIIYPVSWTPDIERVFEYYDKLVEPDRSSIHFTSLFYILILVGIALVAAAVYAHLEGII
ncbi:MAG: hypothetical protein HKP38_07660 [Croceitalea sp.]|nr:hypothetical protein [Croceitalea sp.]NNL09082.1 hypothetical protein [Croceitalea sp.]